MKIQVSHIGDGVYRFMLSLHRNKYKDVSLFHLGRLYRGYVGLMWNTRWFMLTIWLYSMEKDGKNG